MASAANYGAIHHNRLGYFDVAIAKIRKTCMQSCAIDLRHASFATCEFCDHRLGYLDVAIAKIRETRMQSCAIDLRHASFATIG